MPIQNWVQSPDFIMDPILVNGVTINAARKVVNGKWQITVSAVGRPADISFNVISNYSLMSGSASDQFARDLVGAVYGAAFALPAP